jgi:hypothetical protein
MTTPATGGVAVYMKNIPISELPKLLKTAKFQSKQHKAYTDSQNRKNMGINQKKHVNSSNTMKMKPYETEFRKGWEFEK